MFVLFFIGMVISGLAGSWRPEPDALIALLIIIANLIIDINNSLK